MSATYDWIKSHFRNLLYHDDVADATVARDIAWVPMGQHFLASLMLDSGTGVAAFAIRAATDGTGTGAVTVKSHADPTVADAPGDTVHLETSAEEVKAALAGATHVSAYVTNDALADINSVAYTIKGGAQGGRFDEEAMTADVIA